VYAYCPPIILPYYTQICAHTRAHKHILSHTYTQLKTKTDTTLCHPRSGTRTRYNTPQHTETNCNTTYCNTATHYNTLQHTATHCNAHIWHHFVPPPSKSQKHQREWVIHPDLQGTLLVPPFSSVCFLFCFCPASFQLIKVPS